jgi:arylsulfatase A-like enzyme
MRILKTFILFLGVIASSFAQDRPNIIFILADDMGYGDVSIYNENSKIATPNIDNLAKAGVQFTDAHTSSAVCTPTRYGILTGRYNWRSRLKESVLYGYDKALIPQSRKTLPSFLKENGYNTAGIGKWHLGWDWNNIEAGVDSIDYSKNVANGPSTLGFDYFYGFSGSLDMPPYVWVENDMPTMVPTKSTVDKGKQSWWREGLTADDFSHEQVLPHITDKTVQYIEENANKEKPFFIYMPLPAPHTPILPTEAFRGKSGLDNEYGDFVMMVDAMVSRIMTTLKEQGIADNTILIFTADNGCSNQADFEQLATKGHDPSYVYRGHKADIFEGGHRVPYIVRWPNKVKPGKSDQLVCTTDLFATVADVLGVNFADNVAEDSYSFLSLLNVPSDKTKRTSIVHHSINGSFAYRKAEWKTIFCADSGGWSDPKPNSEGVDKLPLFQVYNLAKDIGEEKNVLAPNPKIFSQHKKELTDIILNGRSTPGVPQKNDAINVEWKQIKFIDK